MTETLDEQREEYYRRSTADLFGLCELCTTNPATVEYNETAMCDECAVLFGFMTEEGQGD